MMEHLDEHVDKSLLHLFMRKVVKNDSDKKVVKNTNIHRTVLYMLFPNLKKITFVDWGGYSIDPSSLLNVLMDTSRPSSLQTIWIDDQIARERWAKKTFGDAQVIESYNAQNVK